MVEINQGGFALDVYEACARRCEEEEARAYLGMSQIGKDCQRALWLGFNMYPKHRIDGQRARVLQFGRDREDFIIADLELRGCRITDRQLEFADFSDKFKGHCDGIIHSVTKKPHILEIKTANDKNFRLFEKNGIKCRPEYYAQAQCYMGYSGLDRALFVIENKNSQALYIEAIHFDKDDFEGFRGRAYDIITGDSKPPAAADSQNCIWCDYFGISCTGEKNERV